jgi:hypothetical protein
MVSLPHFDARWQMFLFALQYRLAAADQRFEDALPSVA